MLWRYRTGRLEPDSSGDAPQFPRCARHVRKAQRKSETNRANWRMAASKSSPSQEAFARFSPRTSQHRIKIGPNRSAPTAGEAPRPGPCPFVSFVGWQTPKQSPITTRRHPPVRQVQTCRVPSQSNSPHQCRSRPSTMRSASATRPISPCVSPA
jgi:hypothetical protein